VTKFVVSEIRGSFLRGDDGSSGKTSAVKLFNLICAFDRSSKQACDTTRLIPGFFGPLKIVELACANADILVEDSGVDSEVTEAINTKR
jgi:hypothetical protein